MVEGQIGEIEVIELRNELVGNENTRDEIEEDGQKQISREYKGNSILLNLMLFVFW